MHPEASLEGIKKCLQEFINSTVKRLQNEEEEFSNWAATIAAAMEAKFVTLWNQPYSDKNTFLSKDARKSFKKSEVSWQYVQLIRALRTLDSAAENCICMSYEIHNPRYEEVHMLDTNTIWNKHAELSNTVRNMRSCSLPSGWFNLLVR